MICGAPPFNADGRRNVINSRDLAVVKILFVACYALIAVCCESVAKDLNDVGRLTSENSKSVSEFEKQVRRVAERTASDERAKKERARTEAQNSSKASASPSLKVFKYQKNGSVMFADSAPFKTPYQVIVYSSCYACSLSSKIDWQTTRLFMREFADIITQASRLYDVDPAFIRAVIHAESAFNPLARSRKGAMGLMQLMPGTALDMGVKNATDPSQNIPGGVKYLAGLLRTFDGDQALAAAAYNAGPKAVSRHKGIPPYEETQTYVKRVNILKQRYKSQMVLATK